MARTSKKMEKAAEEKVWKAGIYARLSVDSNERKNESIDTQIDIAKNFINQATDIDLLECYTDLGETGTDFNRGGFEHMMTDIRQKRINCIVVKDFSRFGRNYIETGNYIEKIFPFMKVRFIAVTDGYDSENINGDNIHLSMNLKNIVNELYARDIAQKVKTAKRVKQEMGSYTGGVPPYGYHAKKIGDKKVLFPEENTKDIVVKIFEMYASGSTYKEIAEELYRKRIQRPQIYHETGKIYCSIGEELQQWTYVTIKWILTNPVYIGTLLQARTRGKSYQGHRLHEIDRKNDVTMIEHTHEPIISEDLYFRVAQRFESQRKFSNNKGFSKKIPLCKDIFKDKIYCGECGQCLTRKTIVKTLSGGDKIRSYYYSCPSKNRIDVCACKCQRIQLKTLLTIIKAALDKEFSFLEMRSKDYCKENLDEAEKKKDMIKQRKIESIRQQEVLTLQGSKLYLKYHEGEISREVFFVEKKKIEVELETQRDLEKRLEKQEVIINKEAKKTNQFIQGLKKSQTDTEFDRELIECLIKKIVVYSEQRVEVIFNYRKNDLICGRNANGQKV